MKGFISEVPNELLISIFSYVAQSDRWAYPKPWKQWLSIMLVCRQWCRLARPFIYRTLQVNNAGYQRTEIPQMILRNGSRLYNHIRALKVMFASRQAKCDELLVNKLVELLQVLPLVREVSLRADLEPVHVPFLRAIANKSLTKLELRGIVGGPSLDMLVSAFGDVPTLKELTVSRLVWRKNPATTWPRDDSASITVDELNLILPSERHRTGSFACLVLEEPGTSIKVTDRLFCWPARLEEVTFRKLCRSRYSDNYQCGSLQNLLSIHHQTLKKVRIGPIPQWRGGIPDFSGFPVLEELHISAYDTIFGQDQTPETVYQNLAAPSLRHLTFDYCTEDRHIASWQAFGENQLEWMEMFLALIVSAIETSSSPPLSRLKHILINFNPAPPWGGMGEDLIWPWHWLQETARVASSYGISLKYSEPGWTMERYERGQREILESLKTKLTRGTGLDDEHAEDL